MNLVQELQNAIVTLQNYLLPPHIVTLIGRFYEGLDDE